MMDTTADGSTRRSSFVEASVTTPVPLPPPSETETAIVPFEPICLESSDCQPIISNECVPVVRTQIATTDILTDLQDIYAKVQKAKLDSELEILSEKDKRINLERELAEKEVLLQNALADNNSLTEALSEKEEQVESLKRQLNEDNERFQELGSILEGFRILKAEEAEKEIPSETLVDFEPKPTAVNTNPPALPLSSSSNWLADVPLPPQPTLPTARTSDASVQTSLEFESRIVIKTRGDNINSVKNNHGVDRKKSDTGFYCLCGTEMKTKYDLRDHIRRTDPSSYVFQCSRCDKTYWRTTDLRKHMMKQHQLRYSYYGCRTCGSQFPTYLELMSHHRVVHNFKTMNGYTKRSDPFAIRHTKVTSEDPAIFLCSCGKKYSIQKSLSKHIYRSRNLIKKKSVVAAKKDKVQKTKRRHGLAKPKNTGCKMVRIRCTCGARFESRRELIKHVQRFEQSYKEEEDAMSDFSNE